MLVWAPVRKTASAVRPCCVVRRDLSNEFATSARLYAEAVVSLTSIADGSGFEQLRIAAELAQVRAEEAGVAYEEHVASHGC